MMRKTFFTALMALALAAPQLLFAYTTSFTLDFTTAGDNAGWSDPYNSSFPTTIATGSSTPADSPAYAVLPNAAPGFNSSPWISLGQAAGANNGISLAVYDGTAGGGGADPADYTVEANMYVVTDSTQRNQQGLVGRYNVSLGNFPFEFFYSHNTPGQTNGYGYRGGGSTTNYGLYAAETANRWVHIKITFRGAVADVALDSNLDGTYEQTTTDIALTATAGSVGFFSVINDPGSGAGIPTQYSYFDKLIYTPTTSAVQDWIYY